MAADTNLWDEANEQCATVAATLKMLGISYVELGHHFAVTGLGVAWADDNYAVLAVNAEGVVYISSGVLSDIAGERLAVLETCNNFNREQVVPAMYLHQDEDDNGVPWRRSVLLQQKYPVRLVNEVAPFFAVALNMMPELTLQARRLLAERGVQGAPYLWNDEQAKILLKQSVF